MAFSVLFLLFLVDSMLAGLTIWQKKLFSVDKPLRCEATLETKSNAQFGFQDASFSMKGNEGLVSSSRSVLNHHCCIVDTAVAFVLDIELLFTQLAN